MTLRCGCYDQADDLVFGPLHQCTSKPALTEPADLPRFVPYSRLVVPRQDLCPATHVTLPDPRYDENPIHLQLGPDELED
jgi:hypothetical protein